MGFRKPDLSVATQAIRSSLAEISSPYNDGWTSLACKRELYQLKCWLEDEYAKLPTFYEEKQWEQERIVKKLQQPEKR
jgi:hypothetical protein